MATANGRPAKKTVWLLAESEVIGHLTQKYGTMNRTLKPPKWQFIVFAAGVVLFGTGVICCPIIALLAPRDQLPTAIFYWFIIPYLVFLIMSGRELRICLTSKLEITTDSVTLMRLNRIQEIQLNDIVSARWGRIPTEGLTISSKSDTIVINFWNFAWNRDDLTDVICFFHERISEDIQTDWNGSYCQLELTVEPLLFE